MKQKFVLPRGYVCHNADRGLCFGRIVNIISLYNEIMTFHDNNNVPPLKDGREWNLPIWVMTQSYFYIKKINKGRRVCWDELAQQWNITIVFYNVSLIKVNRIAFVDKCLSKPIQNRSCKLTKLKQPILELEKECYLKIVEGRALKLFFNFGRTI